MKKLTLNKNDKFYLDFFSLDAKELYKIDKKYDENIDIFLDSIFFMLLNSYDIKFQEKYI
jgi:hypothetical protein